MLPSLVLQFRIPVNPIENLSKPPRHLCLMKLQIAVDDAVRVQVVHSLEHLRGCLTLAREHGEPFGQITNEQQGLHSVLT